MVSYKKSAATAGVTFNPRIPSNSNWESPSPRSRMGVGPTSVVGWKPAFISLTLSSKCASNRRAESYGVASSPKWEAAQALRAAILAIFFAFVTEPARVSRGNCFVFFGYACSNFQALCSTLIARIAALRLWVSLRLAFKIGARHVIEQQIVFDLEEL